MPASAPQTGRCRRCGGPLGAGSQQGVCLACVERLRVAKQARETGARPAPTAAAAKKAAASTRRESVRSFTCVDCGSRFFDVDISSKRLFMVDGQPVCAVCLKKRKGMGPWPFVAGGTLVAVALVCLYPLQALAALILTGFAALGVVLYFGRWPTKLRATIAGVAIAVIVASFFGSSLISRSRVLSADDEAVKPFIAECQKYFDAKDRDAFCSAVERFKQALAAKNVFKKPERFRRRLEAFEIKAKEMEIAEGIPQDPAARSFYLQISSVLPPQKRWGRLPIKPDGIKREEIGVVPSQDNPNETVDLKGFYALTIEMYAPENCKDESARVGINREIVNVLVAGFNSAADVDRVLVVVFARDGENDVEIGRFGMTRKVYTGTFTAYKTVDSVTEWNPIIGSCSPQEWHP